MIDVQFIVGVHTGPPGPGTLRCRLTAGPGDEDDDVTPIGDPPDDDEGDDWDDEDDDEEDDEDPLQAAAMLRRSIATDEASRHNGVRLTGR